MKKLVSVLFLFAITLVNAQEYFPTNTGVKTSENTTVAFTNAKIYLTPNDIIKSGTLLVKDGKVIAVGKRVTIPEGTPVHDLSGKTIYPSFVDAYSQFGIKVPSRPRSTSRSPQYDAGREGYYWNDHIRPETDPLEAFKFDNKAANDMIAAGFGVVNTHMADGIVRGNGVLVALNTKVNDAYRIIDNSSAQYLSFNKSVLSRQSYPSSLMGSMALLRQMYLDADWYAKGMTKNKDRSLEALNANKNLSQIFHAGSYLNALRADKVGDEFGIQYTIVGGGDEFTRINEIKNTNATFILPINFRAAYDVSNPLLADQVSLSDMRMWNQEPTNPGVLAKNNVPFALTTYSLKSVKGFHKNVQKAIAYGLDKTKALEALTTVPASILGNDKIGNLNVGAHANFIITSGDVFDAKTTIYENWVQGTQHVVNDMNIKDISGDYTLTVGNTTYELSITGAGAKQSGSLKANGKKVASKFKFNDRLIQLTINDKGNFTRLLGNVSGANLQGNYVDNDGNEASWTAVKKDGTSKDKKKEASKKPTTPEVVAVSYPNIGVGNVELPKQQDILITNATVWTSEANAELTNTDVLIVDGKISKIGKGLRSGRAKVIDGTGKYLTAGIIDEHSHIATSVVNESGHNSTAEVTIEDVVNPDDINIYRNLAGGVTSIQILHGSANPIGGRSAIIKLKWGESAEKLIYDNTPKFIKFALGENVKQSNWGDTERVRFPQTRMGTEQVFVDYFQRAKEYDMLKKSGKPYRKDIEMETLAEILNKERFISCHSYVQSEINMLMKVADQFNFNINTFTHILEGYKVAQKMKEHGVGGSTFSDWWAYKYEVNDAIPFNAAIMHEAGVTVAINSDDREMSRRLNQEAAKTIKYGGVSAVEAWKMVTINPAKLLHIDDRVGSIKEGKDADVVLWNANPLSVYAKAEKTIINGTVYFDIEQDLKKREAIKKERATLISMMLNEKMNGGKVQAPKRKMSINFQCDTEL